MDHVAEFIDAPLKIKCGAASNGRPARMKMKNE
jgi:hypothetical protein